MNKINQLFANKPKRILSIYFTAGYPGPEDTVDILNALNTHGADLIEVGIPYSDPLADGPVIQNSGMQAIENGMTIKKLFSQLMEFKNNQGADHAPMILMGYLNPVLQYGFENFCKSAQAAGISGVILPDLPIQEYEKEYRQILEKYDLHFIFLVTPETSEERIRKIDSLSSGFIYAVSSSSVTGQNTNLNNQVEYFTKLQNLNLNNKILIGFGIRDAASFNLACTYTSGAIIGSAYIQALSTSSNVEETTGKFLNAILEG